jgi:hypothetical protein
VSAKGSHLVGQSVDGTRTDDDLLNAVRSQERAEWRRFVRHYQPLLREVVCERIRDVPGLASDEVDEILASFWLRMFEDNVRLLRSFDPGEGKSLDAWLKLHVASHAVEYLRKLEQTVETVPLSEVEEIAAPEPLVHIPSIFAPDATERFIDVMAEVYTRRLLKKLKAAP